MTMRKSPRVTIVMGSVSSTSTGLTSTFTRPSTSAAISADPKLATAMPGNSHHVRSPVLTLRGPLIARRARGSSAVRKARANMARHLPILRQASIAVVVGLEGAFHRAVGVGGLILAPLAAGVAVPVWNRVGAPLTRIVQGIYRKLLALPIARGWIRA
ncbi:hypothetical protein G6F65_016282 [Rhizopus arrhizus]|nr:hypothetical protein G6F65_016282 [Rhizopus arrhizus]